MVLKIRALLVTAGRHGAAVRDALESHGVEVDEKPTCRETREALEQNPEYNLIISDVTLLDGNWWTIYRELARLGHRSELVVCVPPEDWVSRCTLASTRGVAEVLVPPFDRASIESLLEKVGLVGCGLLGVAAGA